MRIKFKDFTGLIESFFRNDVTVPRTYQFPDKDITVAGVADITASAVGLGSVNNTSDANKPVSTPQQTALNLKLDAGYTIYTKIASYALLAADLTDTAAGKRLLFIMDSASGVNFTVPADATVNFAIGTQINLMRGINTGQITIVQGGAAVVTGSAGDLLDPGQSVMMTLTKTAANAWTLNNGSTAGKYADWTPTFGGFSSAPTSVTARYTLVNKMCHVQFTAAAGTSNATTYTVTLPFASASNGWATFTFGVNNTVTLNTPGRIGLSTGSVTLTISQTMNGTAWTASGTKVAVFNFVYEIQ